MIVVSNTSPLNYLVLIGGIHVLPALYGRIIIPGEVRRELLDPSAPALVRQWASRVPDWVETRVVLYPDYSLPLDPGERDALSLAMELKADLLLLDERRARQIASDMGLDRTGVLGILEAAAEQGIQDPSAITRLERDTNFRAGAATFQASRERAEAAWRRHHAP
jgi:predicted nucleic acid-binding protein